MTSLSSQYLYRAQELFDQYRHEQRQLARAQPAPQRPVVSKPSREFWDFLYEDDATAAPAEDARALQLDRLAAALRIAVSELVGVYCDEIRRSPWYIASQRRRAVDVAAVRAPEAPERRLIAFARSLGRELRAIFDTVMDPTRAMLSFGTGLDGELGIFERWRELRFNLSRLQDRGLELGLPQLSLPKNSYIPKDRRRANLLESLALAIDQGPGSSYMLEWLQENLLILNDALNAWIAAAEQATADPDLWQAEQEASRLEDDVVAAARERLPANLRAWYLLPE